MGWGIRWSLGGALTGAGIGAATPALAHHMMGGRLPSTFMEGLLSGLGHPVIGPDHLAFIIAIGIAAAVVPHGLALIAAFIAASTAGVLVHVAELGLPLAEQLVALTVVIGGTVLALGRGSAAPAWIGLATIAGLLHGYAFGETIVGAERGVLGAYLLGLALIMAAIALGTMALTRLAVGPTGAQSLTLRAAGALVGCIGAVMLVASAMPA